MVGLVRFDRFSLVGLVREVSFGLVSLVWHVWFSRFGLDRFGRFG